MSELLTRGQLMDLVRDLDNTAEYLAGSDGIAAADILKHDAALRQQLATVTQERDAAYNKGFVESHDACAKHFDLFGLQAHRESGYHVHQLISCVLTQLATANNLRQP